MEILGPNLFDSDTGAFVCGQTVVVRGGLIAAVGPHDQVRGTNADTVLEGTGKFLIPGLVNAHFHLTHPVHQAAMTGDEIRPRFQSNG